MASLQSFSSLGYGSGSGNKISKSSRHNKVVKPILKKIGSTSEKNSLDLDRGWNEQEASQYSNSNHEWSFNGSGRSAKDVSFGFPEASGAAGGRRYNHQRTISGTSHISVATSGSGSGIHVAPRAGAFVHPFQQTPRTATPPISYANSTTSFAETRDYSPTIITEDEDDFENRTSHSNLQNHTQVTQSSLPSNNAYSLSQTSLRRPSLTSQRTSSLSDIHGAPSQPSLRINTNRSIPNTPAASSRLAHVSSHSDLQLHTNTLDSAGTGTGTTPPTSSVNQSQPGSAMYGTSITSPTGSSAMGPTSPISPLRSSIDIASSTFRLRAKSDVGTRTHAENIREARRKFEAREQAKEEKYAREQIKKREREDAKRAVEAEKNAAILYKQEIAEIKRRDTIELEAGLARGKHVRKISESSRRASMQATRSAATRRPSMMDLNSEKFSISRYDTTETRSPPAIGGVPVGPDDVIFKHASKRPSTYKAKKKTHSTWTSFILWFRTRLLRMKTNA